MDPESWKRVKFRGAMARIANQLSRMNVEELKFMCQGVVPVARMERVRGALELFQALEERGKLSMDNLGFLSQILISVGCDRVLGELERDGFSVSRAPPRENHPTPSVPDPNAKEYLFTECLMQITHGLKSEEVQSLSYTWSDPYLGINMEKIFSATQLFQLLQQRQVITPDDLRPLFEGLYQIGRSDLCHKINNYLRSTGKVPYNMVDDGGRQGGIRPMHGRPDNRETVPQQATEDLEREHEQHQGFPPTRTYSLASTCSQDSESSYHTLSPTSYTDQLSLSSSTGPIFTGPLSTPSTLFRDTRDPYRQTRSTPLYPNGFQSQQLTEVHVSMEETNPSLTVAATPQEIGETNPYRLTFDIREESEARLRVSQTEIQDLQTRLSQKESDMKTRELEIERLRNQLSQVQQQRSHGPPDPATQDREMALTMNIQQLNEALRTKNAEVEELRQELYHFTEEMEALRAAKPVEPSELYRMNRNPHGICLIINNHKFYHPEGPDKAHPDRGGAEIDQFNLAQTFRYLRYKVEVQENLTAGQMSDLMMQMCQRDHSHYDSFACCILTHGERDVVHGADSQPVSLYDLTGLMKLCTTLRGKPKIFFIQACRGDQEDKGFDLPEKDSGGVPPSITHTIPQEADFFFGYATPPGNAAYRSRRHGSWYISELCKVFTEFAYHSNLSSMMKKVNNAVARAFTKDGLKQCAEYVDRLRMEVHFFHFIKKQPKPQDV